MKSKSYLIAFVLLSCVLLPIHADPDPEPEPEPKPMYATARRSSFFNEPASAKFRSNVVDQDVKIVADVDADEENDEKATATGSKDTSSGRLFLRKFLLFRNIFGNTNTQPVIPIIITGSGTGTGTATNPSSTVTTTGTVPSATGTITATPTGTATGSRTNDDDTQGNYEEPALDEEAVQAALASGVQEYVVTDENIQGTAAPADVSKATRKPARVNLRRKGTRPGQGQVISVRVPPRYRNYFKNGQKVMLNTSSRPGKRRVIRKRVQSNRRRGNKNRKNKNRNNRTRITAV